MKLFLDSSVLISGMYSAKGASAALIALGDERNIDLIVSFYVLLETKVNFEQKYPQILPLYEAFVDTVPPANVIAVDEQDILPVSRYTEFKDAPVVAAAIKANVDYLVTLDKRHLLTQPQVSQQSGLPIVTPRQALDAVRHFIYKAA